MSRLPVLERPWRNASEATQHTDEDSNSFRDRWRPGGAAGAAGSAEVGFRLSRVAPAGGPGGGVLSRVERCGRVQRFRAGGKSPSSGGDDSGQKGGGEVKAENRTRSETSRRKAAPTVHPSTGLHSIRLAHPCDNFIARDVQGRRARPCTRRPAAHPAGPPLSAAFGRGAKPPGRGPLPPCHQPLNSGLLPS